MIGHASIYSQGAGLLLDLYPAHSAWGLSKLRTAYTGSAIRIRRSSDNAEQDIGFSGVDLDTAAISSFVGANSAFVTTIYYQVGANYFIQLTAGNQPRIVNAGVLETLNGKPALRFIRANNTQMSVSSSTATYKFLHDGTHAFMSIVCQAALSSGTSQAHIIIHTNAGAQTQHGFIVFYEDRSANTDALVHQIARAVSGAANLTVNNTAQNVFVPNEQKLLLIDVDPANATAADRSIANFDGGSDIANNALTNAPSSNDATNNLTIGRIGATTLPLDGYIQHMVIWNTDQSANKSGIQSIINNYYGIF